MIKNTLELAYDLLDMIFHKSDFITQIRFRQIISLTYEELQMKDFSDREINSKLTDEILKNYVNITKLNASKCKNVTNVNHLLELQELEASYYSGIDQAGIRELHNLIRLVATKNTKILNVNHMTKLEELDASGVCG